MQKDYATEERRAMIGEMRNRLEDKKPDSWIKEIIGCGVIFALLVAFLYALGFYQIITS